MSERPALAKSELEVVKLVWKLKSATVRQVLDAMPADRGLDFKTVQTYLRRLEEKGYLSATQQGRAKVYRAKVRPKTVVRELVGDFVGRVFEGDPLPLVQNIIEDKNMTQENIDRLRDMLNKLEARDDS